MPTGQGSRYLQQLCKHWSHSLAVEFDAARGRATFPRDARGADWPADGEARFAAEPDHLRVEIVASSVEHEQALRGIVERHLDRFAFREAPIAFDWR